MISSCRLLPRYASTKVPTVAIIATAVKIVLAFIGSPQFMRAETSGGSTDTSGPESGWFVVCVPVPSRLQPSKVTEPFAPSCLASHRHCSCLICTETGPQPVGATKKGTREHARIKRTNQTEKCVSEVFIFYAFLFSCRSGMQAKASQH